MRIHLALENEITNPTPSDAPVAAAVVHPEPTADLVVVTPAAVEEVSAAFASTQQAALETSAELIFALQRALESPQLNAQDVSAMRVAVEQMCCTTGFALPERVALEANQASAPRDELYELVGDLKQTFRKILAHTQR